MEGQQFKELVFKRTNISPAELECNRAKSFMTPCIARDGDLALDEDKCCVGCNFEAIELITKEIQKHSQLNNSNF